MVSFVSRLSCLGAITDALHWFVAYYLSRIMRSAAASLGFLVHVDDWMDPIETNVKANIPSYASQSLKFHLRWDPCSHLHMLQHSIIFLECCPKSCSTLAMEPEISASSPSNNILQMISELRLVRPISRHKAAGGLLAIPMTTALLLSVPLLHGIVGGFCYFIQWEVITFW